MKLAVIPGTYDPLTKGHYDIISRAADLFDRVLVAVAASPGKHPIFTLDERIDICKASFRGIENIEVEGFSGLLVSFLREKGAHVLVRGHLSSHHRGSALRHRRGLRLRVPARRNVPRHAPQHGDHLPPRLERLRVHFIDPCEGHRLPSRRHRGVRARWIARSHP